MSLRIEWCSQSKSEPIMVQDLLDRECAHFLLMPTRRDGTGRIARVINTLRLADAVPNSCVIFVDGSPDPSLLTLLEEIEPQSAVLYIRNTVPSDLLHPQYRLRFPHKSSMQILHDDDWWDWKPSFTKTWPALPHTVRPVSTPVTNLESGWSEHKLRRRMRSLHLNFYFGILPGEFWNAFAEYASKFRHPADSLDIALIAGLQISNSIIPEPDFVYRYDDTRWLEPKWANSADTRIARQCGWGDYSGPSATAVMSCFDSLALTASFEHLSTPQMVRSTTREILRRFPPRLRNAPLWTKRAIPRDLRVALGESDGRLGATSRIKGIGLGLKRQGQNRSQLGGDPIASLLSGEKLIARVSDAIESLDTLEERLPSLSERTQVWRPLIQRLG